MSTLVYFDSDAFRCVGSAFRNVSLAPDVRQHILHSQITLLEVISQVASRASTTVLAQIQAIRNFTNPGGTGLLPWPEAFIASVVFKKPFLVDDANLKTRELEINACLNAQSAEEIREPSGRLRGELERYKSEMARALEAITLQCRATPEKFTDLWVRGVTARAGVEQGVRSEKEIALILGALYEFDRRAFESAVRDPDYPADEYKNDNVDREQLIYLADPALHFITCDKQYSKKVSQSEQSKRIHTLSQQDLDTSTKVEAILRDIIGAA